MNKIRKALVVLVVTTALGIPLLSLVNLHKVMAQVGPAGVGSPAGTYDSEARFRVILISSNNPGWAPIGSLWEKILTNGGASYVQLYVQTNNWNTNGTIITSNNAYSVAGGTNVFLGVINLGTNYYATASWIPNILVGSVTN